MHYGIDGGANKMSNKIRSKRNWYRDVEHNVH